jgi:hypothetical protein
VQHAPTSQLPKRASSSRPLFMLGGSQPETTVDVDKNTIARTGALSADELVPEHTKLIPHDLLRCFGLDEARLVAANEAVNRSSDGSGSKGSGPGGQGHAQYGGSSSLLLPLARRPSDGAQQLQPARETSHRRAATKQAGLGGAFAVWDSVRRVNYAPARPKPPRHSACRVAHGLLAPPAWPPALLTRLAAGNTLRWAYIVPTEPLGVDMATRRRHQAAVAHSESLDSNLPVHFTR